MQNCDSVRSFCYCVLDSVRSFCYCVMDQFRSKIEKIVTNTNHKQQPTFNRTDISLNLLNNVRSTKQSLLRSRKGKEHLF